ncbi:MAG: hypothetical protein A3G34_11060 [Candidatus Lindowbacteria bacterium RIFCSPLOWO2_12_FULL_62_27]|nr:MAG: hypothetical protein A3G34_11060 [Candidatus Lindowbacteria bacterium RIFCSPLOWO2_12_FULL_62_27]
MNSIRRCGILLALAALLQAGGAWGGYRVAYEAVSYSEEGDTPEVVSRQKNAMWIDKGKLRTVNGDVSGYDLIADLNARTIYVLDAKTQAYSMIEFPPAIPAETEPAEGIFLIEEDETAAPVLGFAARRYRIYEDSALIREITTTQEITPGFDFMRAMEGLERAFQAFAPSDDYEPLSMLFRKVHGLPLNDIQYYPYGRDVLEARKIERVKFSEEEFLPPKHYVKRDLRNLSEEEPAPIPEGAKPPAEP